MGHRLYTRTAAALGLALACQTVMGAVQYRQDDFVLVAPPPALSELAGYQARLFDDQMAQSRSITAAVGTDNYACALALQDVARAASNGEETTLAVLGYRGCPFTLSAIAPESWLRLREPMTIDIERVEDGVVYVTPRTTVPFVSEREQFPYAIPTAIGVTWRFRASGMRFATEDGEFVTGRPGATIAFTGDGARFTGFSSVPRRAGLQPSTNGWARATMQAVQGQLTRLGYDPGPVDGLWGQRTRDALLVFQRRAGLEATGTLDSVTLDELGI